MGAGRLIRPATAQDIPAIIDMIERLRAAVDGPLAVDRVKTGETLAGLLADPDGLVLVSDGGFIAGCIREPIISRDRFAQELGWYAEDRSGLRLLRAFEAWARERGAVLVQMSCAGGEAQRLLERRGYRAAEIAMVRV